MSLFNFLKKTHDNNAPPSNDDGIIRVSIQTLIDLHRGSKSIPLKPQKIRSLQTGAYISPFKGRGMEFDEVRPYMAGDDVRTLDWRVTARTGRAHTKLFREERERAVLLWVDLRRPMYFATQGAFKSVRAAQSAALLGWSITHHGDRLGGLLFSDDQHIELRPKRGKPTLLHLFNKLAMLSDRNLADLTPSDPSQLQQALMRLRRVAQPGSLIFLMSDFDGLDKTCAVHLANLARHCDVVLVSIDDPIETDLPPAGLYRVSDGEQFQFFNSASPGLRHQYKQRYETRKAELSKICSQNGIYSFNMSTADDPLAILRKHLGGM